MRRLLAALVLMASCKVQTPPCRIPSPPILPDIPVARCGKGIICMNTDTVVAWAKWSDDMIRWTDMANKCPGVQDTGRPMPPWKPDEKPDVDWM